MKQEPELIDIFAMFISVGLAANGKSKNLAEHAYVLANEMMWERQNFIGEQDDRKTD
tara:strand:- start:429 stop:599 length:171 start_codon:yes stop_codon:yes gene_type:complete